MAALVSALPFSNFNFFKIFLTDSPRFYDVESFNMIYDTVSRKCYYSMKWQRYYADYINGRVPKTKEEFFKKYFGEKIEKMKFLEWFEEDEIYRNDFIMEMGDEIVVV